MIEPDLIKDLALGVSFFLNLGLVSKKLFGKGDTVNVSPQPLKVQGVQEFVTAEHCGLLHKNFEDRLIAVERNTAELFRLQREGYNKLMESAAEARAKLHAKIDAVAADVAKMSGTIEPLKGMAERFAKDVGRLEGILQRHS